MKTILKTLVLALLVAFVQTIAISAEGPAPMKKEVKKEAKKAAPELTDINSASAEQLQKLTGIGPAISAKIIAGRPYKGKDDLVKKKALSKAAYAKIKDKIVAKQ